ncbi:ATP-binding protein [Streptomyces sp. NPDC012746]|uniref:ATP-binding protein n=1 Tax=Streptomyces sp. NPDC012746 TaxID=3364845 RepID=UPI00369ED862
MGCDIAPVRPVALRERARHQRVPPGRGYRLRLLRFEGVVRVEVHDSGAGRPRIAERDPSAERGRGLLLVAALADRWGVGVRTPGKVVWAEFDG